MLRSSLAAALLLALCLLAPGAAFAQQDAALHESPADDAAPAAGHAGVDARHYRFALTLSDSTNRISGTATARVRFTEGGVDTLALDLVGKSGEGTGMTVESVERIGGSGEGGSGEGGSGEGGSGEGGSGEGGSGEGGSGEGGNALRFDHDGDRLRIALAEAPEQGETRAFRVRYGGVPADGLIIADNQFGDRTFFGDHWPRRAHHYLPSIDHPADKATVAFVVTAPDAYEVVASGRLEERTDLPGPTSVTRYRTRARLPMKVAVIGAARFAVGYPGAAAGTPLESWVYPQSRSEGFDQMAQAERIVEFFAENIGPFPFVKLANVESKTRYGGMENAGSIFYSEDAVAEGSGIEPLIAHEIAHQWFGDAVTETSYAHLWLSEGFATYLTDLYIEDTYGAERFRERMRSERQSVAEFARQNMQTPLVNTGYDDPMSMLNPFSYQKGAWVLHMLRRKVGIEAFWKGLQRHYERYRGGNADTENFRRSMEAASGQDLTAFFEQWTRGPALPRYEGTWRYEPQGSNASGGRVVVELRQRAPADFTFALPLEIGIYPSDEDGSPAEPRVETMQVNARQETFSFSVDAEPARVALDPHVNTLMTAEFERE